MILSDDFCYTATVRIGASAERALTFMKDPIKLGQWAFGSWQPITELEHGIYQGTSLFDGVKTIYRLNVYEKIFQIDYEVGYLGGELVPWIVVRIIPGPVVGREAESSLLSLIAWRNAEWGDDDWKLLGATHEAEVFRIRHLVESGG